MTKAAFKKILEEILDVPPGSLTDSDTRETIAGWSSLTDVQILTAIWSDLGVEAEAEDFEFETVGELMSKLEENQAFSAYRRGSQRLRLSVMTRVPWLMLKRVLLRSVKSLGGF